MVDVMNRRRFLESALALAAVSRLRAQSAQVQEWDGPVLDVHLHLRPTMDGNFNHIQGSGVTKAVLLTNVNAEDHAKEVAAAYPGRFVRFASIDVTQPDASVRLRDAIRDGAIGLGEIKSQVEAAGLEMRRLYALAAELDVPITIHFQEISQPGSAGTYNRGWKKFDAMLKAYPKTTFIGHADAFWANVSADYHNETAYPSGPIALGGITDRLLSDYPNLYGDLSANSGNNVLSRDPGFTRDFPAAIILVQHMPATFTSQYAAQLAEFTEIRVKEAESNVSLAPGTLYICPGGQHLRITPTGRIQLDGTGGRINGYLPNMDVTMESVAAYAGPLSIAAVLTGMGNDGTSGARAIKNAGGLVLAQDEATCVIFGMPAEAIKAGVVDQVLSIDDIYQAIERRVVGICKPTPAGVR